MQAGTKRRTSNDLAGLRSSIPKPLEPSFDGPSGFGALPSPERRAPGISASGITQVRVTHTSGET